MLKRSPGVFLHRLTGCSSPDHLNFLCLEPCSTQSTLNHKKEHSPDRSSSTACVFLYKLTGCSSADHINSLGALHNLLLTKRKRIEYRGVCLLSTFCILSAMPLKIPGWPAWREYSPIPCVDAWHHCVCIQMYMECINQQMYKWSLQVTILINNVRVCLPTQRRQLDTLKWGDAKGSSSQG